MTAPLPPTGINIFNLLGARFPHLRRRAFSHHSGASLRATGSREVLRVPDKLDSAHAVANLIGRYSIEIAGVAATSSGP